MEKRDILIVIALFLIAFSIRVVGVSNVYMVWDEWLYWFKTFKILANNWLPVSGVFWGPSPVFSYIEAVVVKIFGGDLYTLRLTSVIFGSLTVPMLYLFGKAMYDRKTGLLAALFLCFSAYHCYYSRIIMLEAFSLFFVTAFLYFFWMSQRNESSMTAIIAGIFLGLAVAAKYLPAFLIPVILIYTLWTKGFKALMDRKMILTLLFAFLTLLPLILCMLIVGENPLYFYVLGKYKKGDLIESNINIERFEKGVAGGGFSVLAVSLNELFAKFVNKIAEIFAWGAWILSPLLSAFFVLSAILLFLITITHYLFEFLSRNKEGSFLSISFITLYLFLYMFTCAAKYYLIYSFPIYFVMLSHVAVDTFTFYIRKFGEKVEGKHGKEWRNEKMGRNCEIMRVLISIIIIIFLFFSVLTSVTSSQWDVGESYWISECVKYIKIDAIKSEYGENILIGIAVRKSGNIDRSIYINNLNASTVRIITSRKYGEPLSIDVRKVKVLKPDYLIVSKAQYDILFKSDVKKKILRDYDLVFKSKSYYDYNGYVFKRKNLSKRCEYRCSEYGKISQDIFKRSVPNMMEVGKPYTVLVQITNTGDSRMDFSVRVHSEAFIVRGDSEEAYINKGSARLFKLTIVPVKEYAGKLPISVDLYARPEGSETWGKADSVTDYVYLIK